jgi:dolichol kinase
LQSCELALSVSTLACCIAEGKSPEEIALISSIFMQLGDTLATIAAHQALCCPPENTDTQKS